MWRARGRGAGWCIVSPGFRAPLLTESLLPVTWVGLAERTSAPA